MTGIAYGRPIVVTHRTRPQHGLPLVRGEEHGRSQDRVGALRALRIAEDGEIQHSLSTSPDMVSLPPADDPLLSEKHSSQYFLFGRRTPPHNQDFDT